MKIIDILNDYANGKIKNGFKFRYDDEDWIIKNDCICSINDDRLSISLDLDNLSGLNDEVEIIQEKPGPIEKLYIGNRYLFSSKDNGMTKTDREQLDVYFKSLLLRYNKLAEAVNYLLKKDNNG